jgi:hypothetical protein
MVEQHDAAKASPRTQETSKAIAENGELLRKPEALRQFGWLLADMGDGRVCGNRNLASKPRADNLHSNDI